MDHTEEDRGSEESFKLISDKKLEPCPEIVLSTLLDIINKSTKRISKRRLPSSQASIIYNCPSVCNITVFYPGSGDCREHKLD